MLVWAGTPVSPLAFFPVSISPKIELLRMSMSKIFIVRLQYWALVSYLLFSFCSLSLIFHEVTVVRRLGLPLVRSLTLL